MESAKLHRCFKSRSLPMQICMSSLKNAQKTMERLLFIFAIERIALIKTWLEVFFCHYYYWTKNIRRHFEYWNHIFNQSSLEGQCQWGHYASVLFIFTSLWESFCSDLLSFIGQRWGAAFSAAFSWHPAISPSVSATATHSPVPHHLHESNPLATTLAREPAFPPALKF